MELCDQIRIARGAAGLSQSELATVLKISKQTIIWWETGIHRPKTTRIRALEKALNVRLDLSERGNATPLDVSTERSLAVDPEILRLAVAIGRLPLAQREAISTLAFMGEKAAIGHKSNQAPESFAIVAPSGSSEKNKRSTDKGVVNELPDTGAGKAVPAKPGSRRHSAKDAD